MSGGAGGTGPTNGHSTWYLVVVALFIADVLTAAGFWKHQQAFELILGQTPRILAASFAAYLVGEFSNSF